MSSTQRFLYRRAHKLKSRKAIDALFARGQRFSAFPFKVWWLPENDQEHLQTAVAVSSRNFKKAVQRNRIKRLMREAYRLQKNPLEQQLQESNGKMIVFILFTGNELPDYPLVYEGMASILQRLQKKALV